MSVMCKHINDVRNPKASGHGCMECLKNNGWWVHLRRCLTCGHIGCCDSSPNKHATLHAHLTHHPLIQSYEPKEDWIFCYVDEETFEIAAFSNSPSHPPGWSPGPPGKVSESI